MPAFGGRLKGIGNKAGQIKRGVKRRRFVKKPSPFSLQTELALKFHNEFHTKIGSNI